MPEERMRFVKVRTRKEAAGGAKTLYLQLISITPAGILGRKISPKSLEDHSFMDASGTIHDLQDLIHKSAIDWHQKMVENRTYGGLQSAGERIHWNKETQG